jgi:hypothetical protein
MLPEATEAIKIADEHLAGESVERRKALAVDIQQAIIRYAGRIAEDAISKAFASANHKKQ